jgi:2-phosphosulfolactate phosphatase
VPPDEVDAEYHPWGQRGYDVCFDWGAAGSAHVVDVADILVVVDVLSFTTSVSVALDRGVEVYPAPWEGGRAQEMGRTHDAQVAAGRHHVSAANPWSLSPANLRVTPFTPRLVLPSPNGSAIAAEAQASDVVAACLRNAAAVAAWLAASAPGGRRVTVIAAGERWPDGSLRPAIEDALGAGAVIDALARVASRRLSPEAASIRALYAGTQDLRGVISGSGSARELAAAGFSSDVEIAMELDSSALVPVLRGAAFRPADRRTATTNADHVI